jgi:hypothetical protein
MNIIEYVIVNLAVAGLLVLCLHGLQKIPKRV